MTDDEVVVAAIFDKMERNGICLSRNTFPVKQFKRAEVSVARKVYTTCEIFMQHVVTPLTGSQGAFLGAAPAFVSKLRDIMYRVDGATPPIEGRAICVLDKVTQGDYDSHAVLAFSTSHEALSENWRKKLRPFILEDVAETFGAALPIEEVFKASIAIPK